MLINCKIRDEYRIVKDIVQERDSKHLSLVPAIPGFGDASLASSGSAVPCVACLSWWMLRLISPQ